MQFRYEATTHDHVIDGLFKGPIRRGPDSERLSCVIVVFVNRSGSNHLCDLMRSTGAFTNIDEILNDSFVSEYAERNQLKELDEYLIRQHDEQKSLGGAIWGFKAAWQQLCILRRRGAIPALLSPVLVKVRRRDVLGQAISFFIAEQTNQWTTLDAAIMKREEIKYDGQRILGHLRNVMHAYSMQDTATMVTGLPVHEVVYEDLLDRPQSIITDLTHAVLGQSILPDPTKLRLQVQRDDISKEFRRRFLSEMTTIDWIPA